MTCLSASAQGRFAVGFIRLAVFCALAGAAAGAGNRGIQETGTRVLENKIPNHVPIRIKVRAEKEASFKKLDNEQWVNDLELEIKNTGDKPIYFFQLTLELPDMTPGADRHTGFMTHFGRPELLSFDAPLTVEDLPLKPGDSTVVKVDQMDVDAWKHFRKVGNWHLPKTVILLFERMNFGDGTGLDGGEAKQWPDTKRPV